MIYLLIKK